MDFKVILSPQAIERLEEIVRALIAFSSLRGSFPTTLCERLN
jgi:hypothetical protein